MRYLVPVAAAVVCGSFWLAFGEWADPSAPDDTGTGIEVVNVFTPQTEEAYANVRIPALAVSKEGTLLAFAEGRRVQSDHNKGPLVLRRSEDGGRTWSEIQLIAEHGNDSLNNPTPVVLANGLILVVYQRFRETFHSRAIPKEGVQMAPAGLEGEQVQRNYTVYSDDDGMSWSAPRDITAQIKRPAPIICNFTGPGPGLVMQHGRHAGRIILPSCDFEIVDGKRVFRSYVTWSDDNGETWQISGHVENAPGHGANETQAVELKNGSLLLSVRARGQRLLARSKDAGATWTQLAEQADLPDSGCMGSVIAVEHQGEELLLHSGSTDRIHGRRSRGAVYISRDNGATWPEYRVYHAGSFDYSSIVQLSDGDIGILAECDFGVNGRYNDTRFVHFPVEWLFENVTE